MNKGIDKKGVALNLAGQSTARGWRCSPNCDRGGLNHSLTYSPTPPQPPHHHLHHRHTTTTTRSSPALGPPAPLDRHAIDLTSPQFRCNTLLPTVHKTFTPTSELAPGLSGPLAPGHHPPLLSMVLGAFESPWVLGAKPTVPSRGSRALHGPSVYETARIDGPTGTHGG